MSSEDIPKLSDEQTSLILKNGEVHDPGLVPIGSNYTFLVKIKHNAGQVNAIYKPEAGEQPLWDFESGTLYKREYAAFLLSELLTWHFVPTTLIREGPYGIGSLQQFIHADQKTNYFTIREEFPETLKRIAIFDIIANNADRKASHCFADKQGRVWSIDHGLTFHKDTKLRTVIWDYSDERIPDQILCQLDILRSQLSGKNPLVKQFLSLFNQNEIESLLKRLDHLLYSQTFPAPHPDRRNIPWPWF